MFSEFCKYGKDPYFFNKGFECDVIIKNADNTLEAVQVYYELTVRNAKRAVGALKKMDAAHPTISKPSSRTTRRGFGQNG